MQFSRHYLLSLHQYKQPTLQASFLKQESLIYDPPSSRMTFHYTLLNSTIATAQRIKNTALYLKEIKLPLKPLPFLRAQN